MAGVGLLWDLIAKDSASPAFLRVAGAADKAATSTLRAQKSIAGSAAVMSRTGAKLTKSVTLPLLAIGAVSVAQAVKFQKSMTLIQTAGGETAAKTAAISKGIKKVAIDTGTSLDDLGHGIYTVAKAGAQKWSATEQLLVLKAAAQGAKAENVDLGVATDALSTIMFDYGAKASQAVKYENMLIRGSGLAKTSMQEYADSLSNVVPIGAAVGLSFQQIGGAIATMTQHGVSAQRATQNLNNLVVNLSGQNNVASQAMQQLGIDTIDLSKNLGKRGLTGTLAIVENALKKHTKNGVVVTDVTKAAKLATASLSTELGTFTGKLKDQSHGLLSGKVGIKDYTTYAKSLGGVAGASALQFLALYKNTLGFSNQLKTGKSTISTTVSQLNKMLGGMTGSNVAMQIGGKYAADNARNVKEMGKAYLESGTDVLGWNKTQDTLAVKMDKAKASLQVLAVEIGTALIPAVSKIVEKISGAVHWFSNLSDTQKKVVAWSAGILVAMGPLLAIGGRLAMLGRGIGIAAVGIGNMFARISGSATGMSLGVTRAMTGLTSALAGAGIGIAVGSLAKNSSTGVKALSALGAAGVGAAIGFGVGGPVGAAIGGLTAGVSSLAMSFLGAGDSAKKGAEAAKAALADQKQDADDLFASLQAVNGAYNTQTRQSIVAKLDKNGALPIAKQAGLKLPALVDTVIGKGGPRAVAQMNVAIENAYAAGKITVPEMNKLYGAMQKLGVEASGNETRLQLQNEAMGRGVLTAAQLGVGYRQLAAAFRGTGRTLDDQTAAGEHNNAVIQQEITHVNSAAAASLRRGRGIRQVQADYKSQMDTLRFNLVGMGFEASMIDEIIGKYRKVPRKVGTKVDADTASANHKLDGTKAKAGELGGVVGQPHSVNVQTAAASSKVAALQRQILNLQGKSVAISIDTYNRTHAVKVAASGGYITGPGSGTSDSIPARLSNGEFVVNAAQTRKHMGLLSAINSGGRGYATGGVVGGTRYTTDVGYENAKRRAAKASAKADAGKVSGAIGKVGQGYTAPFQVADSGIGKIRAQIRAATAALNTQIHNGLKASTAASFRAQIHDLTALANKQLSSLRVKIRTTDVKAITTALKGTAADARAAFNAMFADVVKAGGSAAMQKLMRSTETRLLANQKTLAAQTQKLADMKDYRSGIKSTLSGAFDPTMYGSSTDLISGLSGATGTNTAYTAEANKLKSLGLNSGLLSQLLESGQNATLQSLAGSSKADIAQVNKAYSGYSSSLTAGSDAATTDKYGKSVTAEQATVKQLQTNQKELVGAMAGLAAVLGKVAARPIELDGTQVSKATDKQLEAMVTRLEKLAHYGRKD